ncbi:MAG: InlB B-repeat-containing protein, partial [Acholeplasmataceae bacterium]|nr:InlB B-repeat-containing protein [Acholeplasmataceae bacterium]
MKKKLVRLLSIPLLAFLLLGITACFDLATEQDVHDAKTALELVFASGESEENVTQNLTLPTSIGVGITVSWTSSNKAVISKAGVVTQQADDVEVELTAKLSKNNINIEKTFIVIVKGIIVYFDVLFDTNEGLPTPFTVEVVKNNKVNAPDLPTRAGYYFEGWYKDDAFETAWNFAEDVVIENTTLYAKWDLIPTYTVSFTSNGGSMVPDIEGVEEFTKITTPVNPTREGYTFEGWFKDVDLEMPWNFAVDTVSEDLTLYAKWAIIVLTVTFTGGPEIEVDYGDTIDAEDPLVDSPLPLFPDVVYTWKLSGVPFDFETPITIDMTLVGSWDIPEQLTITTQDQFHYMATVETTYSYVMANDLDFDTYTWVDTQSSFKGSFDGQMYTISNLTILATNGYGGIFARANGATIENLVIENIHVETTARAGALIGRVENNDVTISNIILVDSVVQGSDSNGVGGLIGLVSRKTTVNSVAIISTSVTAIGQKNVGGFVGRVDSAELIANDIFIHDVVVTSTASSGEDIAAG